MKQDKPAIVSDEHLNAFIDNQLDYREKSEVLDALRHDTTLGQRSCELQKIQDLVQLTYPLETGKQERTTAISQRRSLIHLSLAACLTLVIGLAAGWVGHQHWSAQPRLLDFAQTIHNQAGTKNDESWKILLHVSSYDPYRLNVLLDETEQLLKSSLESSQKLHIEILTNSDGLKLFDNQRAHFRERLQDLQSRYSGLILSACNQALNRAKKQSGIEMQLLPEIQVVNSAIGQVLKRQKQGWTYIRI